jgi:hypothetical protein
MVFELCRCCGEMPLCGDLTGMLCESCVPTRHECPNRRDRAVKQWPATVAPLTRAEVVAARLDGDRDCAGEWWAECGPCEDFAGPFGSEAAAVQAAGGHDDRFHGGVPVADVAATVAGIGAALLTATIGVA